MLGACFFADVTREGGSVSVTKSAGLGAYLSVYPSKKGFPHAFGNRSKEGQENPPITIRQRQPEEDTTVGTPGGIIRD